MTAVAALVVVVVAVPHRTSVPTGPDLQAPRVQTADVTRSPESRAPSPVAAAPVAPPAAPGVAAVTRNPAPLAAPVADTGKTAPKVAADDPAPVRPPKADPPTWAELTRRRNATTEPAESANVAASIESVALAIGGDSPDAEPAPAAPAAAAAGPLVTVTGCLEMTTDQEEFRLTETEGADAPRSRSWRSGFLRKKSAPVALVDGPGAAALKGDVGKRVAATGVLSGRDLALQSLRVVAASCE